MEYPEVGIIPVEPEQFETYIRIGRQSYSQHYLHLWEDRDPAPYFNNSFHLEAVKSEWKDPNCLLFLIEVMNKPAGILKILLNKSIPAVNVADCIFLERIYILREYSGKGLGAYSLEFIDRLAEEHNKDFLCLESMQKGRALEFYKRNGFSILGEKLLNYPGLVASERPMYIMGKKLK